MRVIAWNIRAGGGTRVLPIVRQIARWAPDVLLLSEFRATPPSLTLAGALRAQGLSHQLSTARRSAPDTNALLLAARWPLAQLRLPGAPAEPARWAAATIAAPLPVILGAMHIPNRATGRKYPFLDAVLGCARGWDRGPAMFVGDTNSGRRGLDEQVPAFNRTEERWIDGLAECGWYDAFRYLRPATRAYTWFSPQGGNGFRIDQAFVNAPLLARLKEATYVWGGRRNVRRQVLSDHAALLLDLADG